MEKDECLFRYIDEKRNIKAEVEPDDYGLGQYYLYVYKLKEMEGTHDYLLNDLDMVFRSAERRFQIPRDGWIKIQEDPRYLKKFG